MELQSNLSRTYTWLRITPLSRCDYACIMRVSLWGMSPPHVQTQNDILAAVLVLMGAVWVNSPFSILRRVVTETLSTLFSVTNFDLGNRTALFAGPAANIQGHICPYPGYLSILWFTMFIALANYQCILFVLKNFSKLFSTYVLPNFLVCVFYALIPSTYYDFCFSLSCLWYGSHCVLICLFVFLDRSRVSVFEFSPQSEETNLTEVTHYIETGVLLFRDIQKAQDTEDCARAIFHAIKHYHRGAVTVELFRLVRDCFSFSGDDDCDTVFSSDSDYDVEFEADTTFTPQAMDFGTFVNGFRDKLDLARQTKNAEFVRRVKKLIVVLMASGFLTDVGLEFDLEIFERTYGTLPRGKDNLDIGIELCDHLSWLAKSGYQAYHGDFVGAWFGSRDYKTFFDGYQQCKEYFTDRITYGESKFLALLDDTIELGERFGIKDTLIYKCSTELRVLRTSVRTKKSANQSRPVPFSMLIYGTPGIGKTTLMEMIYKTWACIDPTVVYDPSKVYVRIPGTPFWDNFTSDIAFVTIDDIAAPRPNSGNPDHASSELIQIINDVPFVPNQASLEDKGRTPFRAKVVLGTTNKKDMNVHSYFTTPAAALRRFPFVLTAKIRDEYKLGDSDRIRSGLSSQQQLDVWDLTLEEVVLNGNSADYHIVTVGGVELSNVPFYTLQPHLIELMKCHQDRQVDSDARHEFIKEQTLCPHFVFASLCSECIFQDDDSVVDSSGKDSCSVKSSDSSKEIQEDSRPEDEFTPQSFDVPPEEGELPEPVISKDIVSLFNFLRVSYSLSVYYVGLCYFSGFGMFAFFFGGFFMEGYFKLSDQVANFCLFARGYTLLNWFDFFIHRMGLVVGMNDQNRLLRFLSIFPESWRCYIAYYYCQSTCRLSTDHKSMLFCWSFPRILRGRYLKRAYAAYGEAAKNYFYPPPSKAKTLLALLAVFGSLAVIYSYSGTRKQPNLAPQGTPFSKVDIRGEAESAWRGKTRLEELPGVVSRSARFEQVIQKYSKNSSTLLVKNGTKHTFTNLLSLGGSLYLLPRHIAQKVVGSECVLTCMNRTYPFRPSCFDVSMSDTTDLAVINILVSPPRSDFRKFISSNPCPLTKGVMPFVDRYGEYADIGARNIRFSSDVKVLLDDLPRIPHALCYKTSVQTFNGLCGSPLFVPGPSGGVILAGMHCAGVEGTDIGLSIPLRVAEIDALVTKLVSPVAVPQGEVVYEVPEKKHDLGPLHHKSVFNYTDFGTAQVYGSFLGFRASSQSRVCDTLASGTFNTAGIRGHKVKPNMRGWLPWRNSLLESSSLAEGFDWTIMQECADAFFSDIRSKLPRHAFDEIHKITQHVALNGQAGCRFVDSINRQTSAGFPYNRSKDDGFFHLIGPTEENQESIAVDFRIQRDLDHVLACYQRGERSSPIFKGSLKDEPIKEKKKDSPRVFMGAPFGFSLVVRMYLLMFTRFFQLNSFVFENAVGVDCETKDWRHFRDFLCSFGDHRVFAGDYSKFDKRQSARIIMLAFQFIGRICLLSKHFDDEDYSVIMAIGTDIGYNFCHFNGDLVQFMGSMPSGNPLTVVINCIVNSLYMRYCYRVLGGDLSHFQKDVHLLTYGDDNICGVSPDCKFFNHTTVQKAFADVGVVYTMPNKEDESVPFPGIQHLDFLKRNFVMRDGHCYCPLDITSIENSLCVWVRSKTICAEWQMADTIQSALRSSFQHGESKFAFMRSACYTVCEEFHLWSYIPLGRLFDFQYYHDIIVDEVPKAEAERAFKERVPTHSGSPSESSL